MKNKIININFGQHELHFVELQEYFNDIGRDAMFMSHYELSDRTGISPIVWREFITDSRVVQYIDAEMDLVKRAKVAVMLNTIEKNNSTGQAQLLNTLLNQTKPKDIKDGPIVVYTFIPPNAQELNSGKVVIADVDPFKIND